MTEGTIILADAQNLVRLGLMQLIDQHTQCQVIAETLDRKEMIEVATEQQPNVVILDYNSPGYFSVEDIRSINQVSPDTNILILSSDNNRENILKVLEYGITAFVTKECGQEEVISAIGAAARGDRFFCTKILDLLMEKHFQPEEESCEPMELSKREVEIVKLICDGLSAKLIAEKLCLSPHTVYTHRKNIMGKLGLKSASELIKYALKTGIARSS